MMIKAVVLGLLVAVCAADDVKGYRIQFTARSVKSDLFVPLRANKKMVLISECNKNVTEPLGILEHTYIRGTASEGDLCTWHLHAPANHVVNVISILFVMEDETKDGPSITDIESSWISLYDGVEAVDKNLLTRYYVTPQERVGAFIQSLSSGQDMTVEIKYHAHKDFATQKMLINYEFLDVDEMMKLLRAQKN